MWISGIFLTLVLLVSCSNNADTILEKSPVPVRDRTLTIAILPEQNVFEQKRRYQPLTEYMSDALDINVKIKLLDSYGSIYNEIFNKEIDGAFFGSFNYVLTRARTKIVPVARPVTSGGVSTYTGIIFTKKDSGITGDISSWRDKKIALVHRATTAGYIFPKWFLKKKNIHRMKDFFSELIFTGSHDTAIISVFNGRADIGAAKNLIFQKLVAENPILRDNLQVLYESTAVPSNTICLRKSAGRDLIERIRAILLEMDKVPRGVETLQKMNIVKFISTKDREYIQVHRMAADLNIDIKRYPFE